MPSLDTLYQMQSHERLALVLAHKQELSAAGLLEEAFVTAYTTHNQRMAVIDRELVREIAAGCDPERIRGMFPPPAKMDSYMLFRGVDPYAECLEAGFSWTSSEAVARQFAERIGGIVVTATVYPEEILFYSNDRREQEFFIIPALAQGIFDDAEEISEAA